MTIFVCHIFFLQFSPSNIAKKQASAAIILTTQCRGYMHYNCMYCALVDNFWFCNHIENMDSCFTQAQHMTLKLSLIKQGCFSLTLAGQC